MLAPDCPEVLALDLRDTLPAPRSEPEEFGLVLPDPCRDIIRKGEGEEGGGSGE